MGVEKNVGGGEREVGWRTEERGTIREKGGGPGDGVAFQTKEKTPIRKHTPKTDKNKPAGIAHAPPTGHITFALKGNTC